MLLLFFFFFTIKDSVGCGHRETLSFQTQPQKNSEAEDEGQEREEEGNYS